MKGILLAGGKGSRLAPATLAISKHLLPVFDKPLIYYSLSNLMLCGIREILIICRNEDKPHYETLFGNGASLGLSIKYAIQSSPGGIPEALLIAESFVRDESVVLGLGDNLFHGTGLPSIFQENTSFSHGARVLTKRVPDPARFGVANLDQKGAILSIEEKPANPVSDSAITGMYFLDKSAVMRARLLRPSDRGELEIVDLLKSYLEDGALEASELPRGTLWLDTGTVESLLDAGVYVRSFQTHTNQLIGSPEEIAFRNGWIDETQLINLAKSLNTSYGQALLHVVNLHSKP